MNVFFHTTAAVGVAVMVTDTRSNNKSRISQGVFAFLIGIILHGALDYIPHCYPVNSKIDVILGLAIIAGLTLLTNKKYRVITGLSFLGSVFPDLVDLSPLLLNKYLGFHLSASKIFPWHWSEYSGSIYNGNCGVSALNHTLLVLTVGIICWFRRVDIGRMIGRNG